MYNSLYPMTYYFYPLLEHDFNASPDKELFLETLARPKRKRTENLLYVHIPYCHDLCKFCPFHVKLEHGDEVYGHYTETLCREMEMVGRTPYVSDMTFGAIYFGGGSPSIFPVESLRKIFDNLARHFQILPDAEISFEGEPRTLADPARQDLLKRYNVRRISFGLQTYDETLRKLFNIVATLDDVDACTRNARERGFAEINVDMMYDLPGQNISMLEQDLRRLKEHDFDSVDYYNLHYYAFPQKFKLSMASGQIPPKPDEEMHFALAEQLRWRMKEMGYHNVADQVFSKTGEISEYFRLLWGGGDGDHSAETVGLGASARGYIDGYAYMNTGQTPRYQEMVENGQLPLAKLSRRLEIEENRGAAFMVKFFNIKKKHTAALQSIPIETWNRWLEEGLLYETSDSWELSERAKVWTTNMMVDTFESHQHEVALNALGVVSVKPGVRTGTF